MTEPDDVRADEAAKRRALSAKGVKFIAHWEGFSGRLYDDPLGHCTIGYGHLVHHGRCNGSEPAEFRRGISQARGEALLKRDCARFEAAVNGGVRVPLDQRQFDALVSFAFNVGPGAFAGSTLLRRLNAREYAAVPPELMRWTNNGLPGLVRRRRAEGVLFRDGRYPAMRLEGEQAPLREPPPTEEGEPYSDEGEAP